MSKINILMVLASTSMGGAEMFVLNLLSNIDFNRFKVDICVCHEEVGKGIGKELRELGCDIYFLPPFKVYNYFSYAKSWIDFFNKHHYDIVHGHLTSSASVYLKIAKDKGMKTISHCHSTGFRGSIVQRLLKYLFTRNVGSVADYWFACSPMAAYNLYGPKYADYINYYTIPNAINAERYRYDDNTSKKIRKSLGISDDVFLCGHVGSFTTPKNHLFLMDVFCEVLKNKSNAMLICCGEGGLMPSVKEKAKELGILDKVIFPGVIHNCNEYLMAMDVFVFPSIYEGFGIAILEAEATGLPSIISDVVPTDVDLTDCIKRVPLSQSPAYWAEIICSITPAINRIDYNNFVSDSKYNMRTSVDMIMSLYDKLLKTS